MNIKINLCDEFMIFYKLLINNIFVDPLIILQIQMIGKHK